LPSKEKLITEIINSSLKEIKVSHKDIAIAKGVQLRNVRKIKKENPETYKIFEDAIKYRYITGELDMRIKVHFTGEDATYWLYYQEENIRKISIEELENMKLSKGQLKTLQDQEILETVITNKETRDTLLEGINHEKNL